MTSLTDKQEVKDLLIAARATRTYCMLTAKAPARSDALIKALEPFDSDEKIQVEQLTALRIAMRDVCQDIDDYTLMQILEGKSPVSTNGGPGVLPTSTEGQVLSPGRKVLHWLKRQWPSVWQRGLLPGIAVFLLLAAMHFTQWTFQANILLNRLEAHLTTDVHEEVRDLIVVAAAIHSSGDEATNGDAITPAQRVFNQSMNKLRAYHFQEKTLFDATALEVSRFNPIIALSRGLRSVPAEFFGAGAQDIPTVPLDADTAELEAAILLQDKPLVGDTEIIAASVEETPLPAPSQEADASVEDDPLLFPDIAVVPALGGRDSFLEVVNVISQKTGRHPDIAEDHVSARLNLQENAEDLKAQIANANRFFLPMIYGALGAALFCLIRVLTPSLSDLGPARAFLRILFGAFAAMTLSMLLIPANIFTINSQSNSTLIFLACFLFGYSFGAVMAALHRMEAFLEGRLQPGEAQKQEG